jgi:hypothetical protein
MYTHSAIIHTGNLPRLSARPPVAVRGTSSIRGTSMNGLPNAPNNFNRPRMTRTAQIAMRSESVPSVPSVVPPVFRTNRDSMRLNPSTSRRARAYNHRHFSLSPATAPRNCHQKSSFKKSDNSQPTFAQQLTNTLNRSAETKLTNSAAPTRFVRETTIQLRQNATDQPTGDITGNDARSTQSTSRRRSCRSGTLPRSLPGTPVRSALARRASPRGPAASFAGNENWSAVRRLPETRTADG